MSSETFINRPPVDLELVKDELKLVSLTFGINFYTSRSFYDCGPDLLATFDAFAELCPVQTLNFYATETMKMHKPVNKRVLDMLPTWLDTGAPRKHYIALELKASKMYQDAPAWKYQVWSEVADVQANILSIALSASFAQERLQTVLALVQKLGDTFPFRCGLAGFSFECSRYDKKESETYAWSTSMRHPGIDIVRIPYDDKAVGDDAIKGVNWLTLLDTNLVTQLGGERAMRAKLSEQIELLPCRYGLIIKAGPMPCIGDVNRGDKLPLYREVYALLVPWIEIAARRSMSFQLVHDYVERTEAWYRRHAT
ncbi:MAG: type VI immunity family protein [Methylobacter sp.]